MIGKRVGQYRIVERLGNGGMGAVYRGVDESLDRPVALKILETEADKETSASRFRTEAAVLARLSHPGIATLYELLALDDDGRLVMVMELVKGQTLHQIVEQIGVLSPQRAAELCMQALEALAHAHAAGVVHRDLKPGNLMLTEGGTIKILDFGIARLEGAVHLTRAGAMMGTPAYMAPEQVLGTVIDARADLYAMGVVFYRLITAQLPFRGDTPFEMAQSQVNDEPTPVNLVRPDLPEWAGAIIRRALAKAPDQRFQSAMEFHEELARCLGALPRVADIRKVEVTEVMERPATRAAGTADAGGSWETIAKRQTPNTWIRLAAAVVVAGVLVWMFIPRSGASPETGVAEQPVPAKVDRPLTAPPPDLPASPAAGVRSTPPPAPAPVVAAAAPHAAAKPEPVSPLVAAVEFANVKWLAVNGTSTNARDARLRLSDKDLSALAAGGNNSLGTVPFKNIAKATYVNARDPKWDPALAGPAGKIDVPGILGRSRHWLVIQTPDTYAILRLDGDDRQEVLKTFEARTGKTIDRK